MTKYWHEALDHASLRNMVGLSTPILGWPKGLTPDVIKKYFDMSCEACKQAIVQRKSLPNSISNLYLPGTRCTVDITDYTEINIGGHSKAVHAVDVGSERPSSFLILSTSIHDFVQYIHRLYLQAGHKLDTMVMNAHFMTAKNVKYFELQQIQREQPGAHRDFRSLRSILSHVMRCGRKFYQMLVQYHIFILVREYMGIFLQRGRLSSWSVKCNSSEDVD